jgi:Xaa-Pro aminopeptidase
LRGCGIRIEDDVLVTSDSHVNLSLSIPKAVNEIEALMSQSESILR